jgi:hypothetical protein
MITLDDRAEIDREYGHKYLCGRPASFIVNSTARLDLRFRVQLM